jgi:DNA mismatch repair protein PMS2
VRLREFGVSGFEVTDNGSGIAADNYAGLTAKYHTSKLNTFEDLASVIS